MGHTLEGLVWIKIPGASYRRRIIGHITIIALFLLKWRLKASTRRFFTMLPRIMCLFSLYQRWPFIVNLYSLVLSICSLANLTIFHRLPRIKIIVDIIIPEDALYEAGILFSMMRIKLTHNVVWAKRQMLLFLLLLLYFSLFGDSEKQHNRLNISEFYFTFHLHILIILRQWCLVTIVSGNPGVS